MNLFLSFFIALLLSYSISSFNLYKTDRSKSLLEYDCLDYYVTGMSIPFVSTDSLAHQLIAYCIRPSIEQTYQSFDISEMINVKNFTFEMLKNANITSEQLLIWSASIDLAERYEAFVMGKSDDDRWEIFLNCTSLQFGHNCQYSLWDATTIAEVVDNHFFYKDDESPSDVTCYEHLPVSRIFVK